MSAKGFRFKKSELGVFNSVSPVRKILCQNCRIGGLTDGSFSLIDLIHEVVKFSGASDVVIVTWSAGIKDAHNVAWMKNNGLIRDLLLVTDHSYKTRQKKYALSIEEAFGAENIRTSEIHAKFTLVSNEYYKFVIRTSMNLNANRTVETFEIDEDSEIFDFYNSFVIHLRDNQKDGFVSSSTAVNKTVSTFFKQTALNFSGWSEL